MPDRAQGLPIGTQGSFQSRQIGRIRSELEFCDIETVMENGLHEFLVDVVDRLEVFSATMAEEFFSAQ